MADTTTRRKKSKRQVAAGQVHVLATFTNTIVTFTDASGGALTSSSAGARPRAARQRPRGGIG